MAQQYRRSLLVFYLDTPPAKGDRGQDFRTLPGENSAEDVLLDMLIRDLKIRQAIVKSLREDEDAEELPFIGSATMQQGAETVAQSIRSVTGFNLEQFRERSTTEKAFSYLRDQIEHTGIFVLLASNLGSHHTKIPVETFRGFAIADPIAPFIVINDQDAKPAWSFTALHETAHLWLGTTGVSGASIEAEIEKFCNDVAGILLLPEAEMNELQGIQSFSLDDAIDEISEFARSKNISRAMVIYKLRRLRLIEETTFRNLTEYLRQEWIAKQAKKKEKDKSIEGEPDYYAVRRHRLGKALLNLVRSSVNAGTLTPTKASKVLGVKPRKVNTLLKDSPA
jgi:Zn-dependent peptidase ImmA (M78 family)